MSTATISDEGENIRFMTQQQLEALNSFLILSYRSVGVVRNTLPCRAFQLRKYIVIQMFRGNAFYSQAIVLCCLIHSAKTVFSLIRWLGCVSPYTRVSHRICVYRTWYVLLYCCTNLSDLPIRFRSLPVQDAIIWIRILGRHTYCTVGPYVPYRYMADTAAHL